MDSNELLSIINKENVNNFSAGFEKYQASVTYGLWRLWMLYVLHKPESFHYISIVTAIKYRGNNCQDSIMK